MEFSKRTWGWYWTLYKARQFKIKLLYFSAWESCSLQRHQMRSETWCFLFGLGEFFCGAYPEVNKHKVQKMLTGRSAYVPLGFWHQYNAIKPTLVLEIQCGTCEENDIERK